MRHACAYNLATATLVALVIALPGPGQGQRLLAVLRDGHGVSLAHQPAGQQVAVGCLIVHEEEALGASGDRAAPDETGAAPVVNSGIETAPAEIARAPSTSCHRAARTVMLPLLVPIVSVPVPAPSVPLRLCALSVRPTKSRSRT